MSHQENADMGRWSGSVPYWEKHGELIRAMFAPITKALLGDAEVRPGDTVLDCATGPGDPALSIADEVGPSGTVIGIDPSPKLIEGARQTAAQMGMKNTRFEIAVADVLPFPAETFDAEICRFGVMFFPSPVDCVREMLRVLKPGKKLAFAVWHFVDNNPFHHSVARIIDRYFPPPPLPPDAPNPFRFASPGKLKSVLIEAGAAEPSERLLRFSIDAPLSVEDFWTFRCDWAEKLREKIAQLPPEQSKAVKEQVIGVFNEYHTERGMSFPAEVLIVTGTKQPVT
jgi:ubiquinone/menaquinone biosynthesis C-methylase UbiE